eukprot:CAMPEP_0172487324 /NCGR_PEP_ID=MMETSP1066-20121228/16359_1 /TAXON_ID=671091 /ORGANISM="Coscinodiscus wailesii, Strain CCMP2513" /LENGTH=2416 /DNA_ID=CAMNT_0013253867 /DNA_START=62 /DNA_END=7312 /DNA_ORIENTATION=+
MGFLPKVPWFLPIALLLLFQKQSFAETFSPDATVVKLPEDNDVRKEIDIGAANASSSEIVVPVIFPVTNNDQLCVLSQLLNERYVPLGRSYEGNDWESSAGRYARLIYKCESNQCEVNLPKEHIYHLTCYQHSLSKEDTVARFLEKTSFGPTKRHIDTWDYSKDDLNPSFAKFVQDELNKTPTYHREYFRKRLNPRSIESYKYGMSGPQACKKNSRWRKYAFTALDTHLSSGGLQHDSGSGQPRPNPRHKLTIQAITNNGQTAYILSYADAVRTVVYEKFRNAQTDDELDMTKSYYICYVTEIWGGARNSPTDRFQIKENMSDSCVTIKGGNPKVNIDSNFIDLSSVATLDLTSLSTGTDLVEINTEKTLGGDLLLTRDISGMNAYEDVCKVLPDPRDNDYRSSFLNYVKSSYPMWTNPSRFAPDPPVFAKLDNNEWAIHDYRLELRKNTIEDPLMDGGGQAVLDTTYTKNQLKIFPSGNSRGIIRGHESATLCANEVPTLFNQEHCKLSYEQNACLSGNRGFDTQMYVVLDETFMSEIQGINGIDSNIPVAIDGLIIDSDTPNLPCSAEGTRSRWLVVELTDCDGASDMNQETITSFKNLLLNSIDAHPKLRDVYYREQPDHGIQCHDDDKSKFGFRVKITENGVETCFENVHPDYLSIYDITEFVNSQSDSIKKEIKTHSSSGILNWISITGFTVTKWHDDCNKCRKFYVGRLGDTMTAHEATDALVFQVKRNRSKTNQALEVIAVDKKLAYVQLRGYSTKPRNGGILVCGSRGEIAADPTKDDYFGILNGRCDSYGWGSQEQKKNVWISVVLEGDDQLRQRMAWALSQILNVSYTTFGNGNEGNLYLYDLYVKNAFGNYKDLLREISFNPKMAEMLTFMKSKCVRFQYDISGEALWPDENYAREFMQLYTIGLHKLKPNGLPILDRYGAVIHTYDTKNILSFARVWTGFDRGARRGNYEELDHTTHTYMGTMQIGIDTHDWFPKMSLDGGYIGDKEPLCWDLPSSAFLKKGAKYYLLGGFPKPRFHTNLYSNTLSTKRIILDSRSELYKKLCNPNGSGDCQFAAVVGIDENLTCYGVECNLATVVVVQVKPGVFYEYVQRPCVQLAFSQDHKKVIDKNNRVHMCAHPKMPVAISSCCGDTSPLDKNSATANCEYEGEKVTFDVNTERCTKFNGYPCDFGNIRSCEGCCIGGFNKHWPSNNVWYWTTESCSMKLKVRIDGAAAIVHDPIITKGMFNNPNRGYPSTPQYVRSEKNMNFITVHWPRDPFTNDELFPTIDNDCWNNKCTRMDDWTCLCDIREENNNVFTSVPTKNEVLTRLRIGAFEPELYDDGDYQLVENSNGVDVYKPKNSDDYTKATIFKVIDKFQQTRYLKNMESWTVIGTTDEFKMQTPSHFIDFSQPTLRDIYYEVEATIESIFKNDSTPPFVSKLLIQHFGISNPSPRYVGVVSTAFFTGLYQWTNGSETFSYGDGKYGNLAATAAAIILDREANSVLLDADPASGSLREPLLKVISLMRSMQYTPTDHDRNEHPKFWFMQAKVGQMPYETPDQFSFFSPDYMPPGGFMVAALTSPEAQVLTMYQTIGLTSGLFSIIRHGLNDGYSGFGKNVFGGSTLFKNPWYTDLIKAGEYDKSVGYLSYNPIPGSSAEDNVDHIARLLTSGRLSAKNKAVLVNAYNAALEKYSGDNAEEYAWRETLQLATTTPEFHVNNLSKMTDQVRTPTLTKDTKDDSYKAIVVLFLFGGFDSFNFLVPHTSCGDLYDSYVQERGNVGLKTNQMNLVIDAASSEQPCDKFVVHHKATSFKEIYDDGEGIFLANTGHLDRKVTKDNWRQETGTDLFSHTSLEQEAYKVDAFQEKDGTGILGRMLDVFEDNGYSVGPNGLNAESLMLGGDPSKGRAIDVVPGSGIPAFTRQNFDNHRSNIEDIKPIIMELNAESKPQNSLYGNYWSQNLVDTWYKSDSLRTILNNNRVQTSFAGHGIEGSFKVISQMIKGHAARKKNRDVFFLKIGGFDAHANVLDNLERNIPSIDNAFKKFRNEMKVQGNYDKVTTVMTSEFGRTLTPNSGGGTDHAWGGNYFMFGGGVKGGRILGKYPETFWDSDPTNIGRGRLIPTLSWDSLWHGIVQWYGVENEKDMKYVLPNHLSFGCFLLTDKDLYHNGTHAISGCNGISLNFHITSVINEPRYLTGQEQKIICEEILKITEVATGQTARCLIVGQQIIVNVARRLANGIIDETTMSLKEYLNRGGSRTLTEGNPTFTVEVESSLSYIPIKKDTGAGTSEPEPLSVVELTQELTDQLDPVLSSFVQNMTGLEEVVATTNAPTISSYPSQRPSDTPSASAVPSVPPSDTPSASVVPSVVPSDTPSASAVPSVAPSTVAHLSSAPTSAVTDISTDTDTSGSFNVNVVNSCIVLLTIFVIHFMV